MATFNEGIAALAGTNAAILADLLKDLLDEENDFPEKLIEKFGKTWCRCSMRMMTVYCPYLTIHQVERALNVMRDAGIIVSAKFSSGGFDHTNWYAFTEYGKRVMELG